MQVTKSSKKPLSSEIETQFTAAPITASSGGIRYDPREYLRLPKTGKVDEVFSLSRSTWNLLILPCEANGYRPPIKSISLRRPGTVRGVRLISIFSAREYFERLQHEQEREQISQIEKNATQPVTVDREGPQP